MLFGDESDPYDDDDDVEVDYDSLVENTVQVVNLVKQCSEGPTEAAMILLMTLGNVCAAGGRQGITAEEAWNYVVLQGKSLFVTAFESVRAPDS